MDTLKANDMQVGGKHYKSEYQHWDFVNDVEFDYYEGCASKYITRRKTNRKEDLQKAIHFLEKRRELAHTVTRPATFYPMVEKFALANGLLHREYVALMYICDQAYDKAIEQIHFLLDESSGR